MHLFVDTMLHTQRGGLGGTALITVSRIGGIMDSGPCGVRIIVSGAWAMNHEEKL